jgi:hypothetical protein
MVFNATFNNIQLYHGGQFYWWRKPQDPEKTTDLPQVTDKFIYYMMLCFCTCCILYILCYVSFNISIELIIQDKLFFSRLYLAFDSELKKINYDVHLYTICSDAISFYNMFVVIVNFYYINNLNNVLMLHLLCLCDGNKIGILFLAHLLFIIWEKSHYAHIP